LKTTHFTEHLSSLIDLILTNDVNFVSYVGVGPPLLDQIHYYCPVIWFVNTPKHVSKSFKHKIFLYDQADIDKCILNAAEDTIPNKFVTNRKQDHTWLINDIRKLIRKNNRIQGMKVVFQWISYISYGFWV
jgi:hypothetical protein